MVSIKEVAELAKVSVPTAYKVFDSNYNTTGIVKERVLSAARELSYVHKPGQQKKTLNESKTVAIIYNELTNSFNNYISRELSNQLERFGYRLVVLYDDEFISQDVKNAKIVQELGVDALIFTPVIDQKQDVILQLLDGRFPLLQLFQTVYPEMDTLLFNDELGTYLATNCLLKSGHRRIMMVSRTNRSEYIRRPGYCRAFNEIGLEVNDRYLFTLTYVNSVKQMIKEKIMQEQPTAIIAVSEVMSATVIQALRELNLSIPEDISLIAYDDYPWLEAYSISAISHPFEKVGSIMARLLVDRLNEPMEKEPAPPSEFMIDPSLILRNSIKIVYRP